MLRRITGSPCARGWALVLFISCSRHRLLLLPLLENVSPRCDGFSCAFVLKMLQSAGALPSPLGVRAQTPAAAVVYRLPSTRHPTQRCTSAMRSPSWRRRSPRSSPQTTSSHLTHYWHVSSRALYVPNETAGCRSRLLCSRHRPSSPECACSQC